MNNIKNVTYIVIYFVCCLPVWITIIFSVLLQWLWMFPLTQLFRVTIGDGNYRDSVNLHLKISKHLLNTLWV